MTEKDKIISYFLYGIEIRNRRKDKSAQIAISIFNGSLFFNFTELPKLEKIRFEFGALEHIGWEYDMAMSYEEYEDYLWKRLEGMIIDIKRGLEFRRRVICGVTNSIASFRNCNLAINTINVIIELMKVFVITNSEAKFDKINNIPGYEFRLYKNIPEIIPDIYIIDNSINFSMRKKIPFNIRSFYFSTKRLADNNIDNNINYLIDSLNNDRTIFTKRYEFFDESIIPTEFGEFILGGSVIESERKTY